MLNVDQSQRRDIDTTLDDRLTLAIDEENIADNPYVFEPTSFQGNNWFKQGNNVVKLNLAEQDSLIFLSSPLTKLLQKDITNVIVSFDYQVSNVSVNYPILSNISLTCMEMTNYMLVENILTTQGHIDVDCSLFNFSSNVVNTSISEQGFKVGINFNGNKSNATIKLCNVQIQFKYQNKLLSQSDSVVNRLEPYVDFWREDDDLVLQIGGDASGKGMDHSGGDIDTYSKAEIDAKLDLKVNTETGKGLSSNDYTLTEKTKLGTIETNANYYVHPSSHQTGMIIESSALANLETSENATQHEINLAIDSKINSGSVDWSDIENKPSDYPPSSHNHDDRYYTESEIDTALSNKVSKSSTSGLLKNDGTVDTSSYITSSALSNYVQKSNTTGLLKNDGTVDTTSYSTFSGSYNDLSNKPTIPTKISDLTNDSDFIEKSNTSGLVKNDGTIDTSTYLTSSALSNYVQKSSTNGLLKNDGTVDTTSYSTFSGSYNDLSNKPSIPTSSSDLSDGSDLVKKSNTSGLLKNDGSVDTNSYLTSSSLSNYVQKSSTTGLLKNDGTVDTSAYITSSAITGKEDTSNKVTSWSSTVNDTHYPSEKLVSDSLATKQATLVSGTNIKTVNNESLLGSGNITIQGGGGSGGSYINDFYGDSSTNELVIDYDTGVSQADIVTSWSSTVSDTNVASEKLTKNSLDGKANSTHNHNYSDLNNVSTVTITVTYSNNTSENITLLKYTGS